MYEQLNALSADFMELRTLLPDPKAGPKLDAIDRAIGQAAEQLGNRSTKTAEESAEVKKLYTAMLAARRVLASLREHHANGTA